MNAPFKDENTFATLALELDLLRTFTAIVDTGSFKAAADLVFRTPSAVSMQVKKLEDIVGRTLFLRDARSVTLTPEGEVLISYARRLLQLSDEAISHFRKPAVEGLVRLGAPDDYGSRFLPQILRRFATTHPAVVVDVVIDQSVTLKERVRNGQLDLALVSCGPDTSSDDSMEVILEEELLWTGVKGGCAHLSEPLPVSMWEEGCAWRSNAISALGSVGREYRVAYLSSHSAGQRAAVIADLAVAPFPKSLIEAPLCPLTEADGLPKLKTYKVGMVKSPKMGRAAEAVAEHVRAAFEEHQARL